MEKFVLILICIAIGCSPVAPAKNVELDKATENDVTANVVSPDKKVDLGDDKRDGGASVQITGITTGAETQDQPPFKPQRAGSMFARLIDDIFQIPITVLQNVAKLITNPFVQQRKNTESASPL